MSKKTAADRWTEMTTYLNTAFPAAAGSLIGNHINTLVVGGMRDTISNQLSLGSTAGVHKNTKANKPARNALRALLLCQRVYFSDLWAKWTMLGDDLNTATTPCNYLPANWKAQSLTRWGTQSEASIRSAIGMFATAPGATAARVSDVAQDDPPNGGMPAGGTTPAIAGNLTYSRTHFPLTGPRETCYRGVLAWLLKAGVVSYRWFMQNPGPSGEDALYDLFGDGEEVWPANRPFTDRSVLPDIPKGTVIHMWMEDSGAGGWNGHWVISNGDGTVCGVNNGEVNKPGEVVRKEYTNTGTLRSQFEGYIERVREEKVFRDGKETAFTRVVRTGEAARARMVAFDPMTLPGRM